jgi:hypothetical protein
MHHLTKLILFILFYFNGLCFAWVYDTDWVKPGPTEWDRAVVGKLFTHPGTGEICMCESKSIDNHGQVQLTLDCKGKEKITEQELRGLTAAAIKKYLDK